MIVAGVAPEEPGYETYHVLPQMGNLKWIEATVPSVKGLIKVAMKRSGDVFSLTVTSPEATIAIVGIPKNVLANIARIKVNGRTIWKQGKTIRTVKGIAYIGEDKHYYKFTAVPVTWRFKASLNDRK